MTLKLVLLLFSAILLIAAVTTTAKFIEVSNRANNVTQPTTEPTTVEPVRTAQTSDEAPSDIQVVLLTLRGEGFEPVKCSLRGANIFSSSVTVPVLTRSTFA